MGLGTQENKPMKTVLILLKTLQLYLALKNKTFYYDIKEKSRIRQKKIIEDMESLRDSGDSNDADRADLLRQELVTERRELESLSTFYIAAEKECACADD